MTSCQDNKPSESFSAKARATFLEHLAETANVTASAGKAKVTSSAVYRLRMKSERFREEWARALTEGLVRVRADLTADALRPISGKLSEAGFKERVQKQRIQMFLIQAHAPSSRATAAADAPASARKKETHAQARKRFATRFDTMRKRMKTRGQAGA